MPLLGWDKDHGHSSNADDGRYAAPIMIGIPVTNAPTIPLIDRRMLS
jgi:hypothetical protein